MSLSSLLEKSTPGLYNLVTSFACELKLFYPEVDRSTPARYLQVTHELAAKLGQQLQQTSKSSQENAILTSIVQLHTAHSDLATEFAKLKQLQNAVDVCTKDVVIKNLDLLAVVERELKNKIRRNSVNLQNLQTNDFLKNYPDIQEVIQSLAPTKIEKTLQDLQVEVDHCRKQYYGQLIAMVKPTFENLQNHHSPETTNTLRKLALLDHKHSLDKRNLLHIAAYYGDSALVSEILKRADDIGLDLNALDATENCAMQYAVHPLKSGILNLFLNTTCALAPLKSPDGKSLLATFPNINNYADITALDKQPLGRIALHHYVHQFYSVEKLVEKMNWLNKISIDFQAIVPLQDHAHEKIRDFCKRFLNLHELALPLRCELARIVGAKTTEATPVKVSHWCITIEDYQDLMDDVLRSNQPTDSIKFVLCLDNLQNKLTDLSTEILKTRNEVAGPELTALNSIITLDLACIQAMVIYLLQQKIINFHYRFIEKKTMGLFAATWEGNKKEAALAIKPIAISNSIAAIKALVEQTLFPIKEKVNLEKAIRVYLLTMLYADNNKQTSPCLKKFEGGTLFSPDLVKRWREAQPHLETVIANTTVHERETRYFGPVIAKFRIKFMLADITKTLQPEQAPVKELFYQALTADRKLVAIEILERALSFFDELDPIRDNWSNLTDIILLEVESIAKYIRVTVFEDFKPAQNSEMASPAAIF